MRNKKWRIVAKWSVSIALSDFKCTFIRFGSNRLGMALWLLLSRSFFWNETSSQALPHAGAIVFLFSVLQIRNKNKTAPCTHKTKGCFKFHCLWDLTRILKHHLGLLTSMTPSTDQELDFSTGLRFFNKRKLKPGSLWNMNHNVNHYDSTVCDWQKDQHVLQILHVLFVNKEENILFSSSSPLMVFAYTSPYNLIRVCFIVVKNTVLGGSVFLPPTLFLVCCWARE